MPERYGALVVCLNRVASRNGQVRRVLRAAGFEQAVNLELLGGVGGAQFSIPTQRDEAKLGYDVALIPALDAIWPMLGRGPFRAEFAPVVES